jgi:hypothetical protein
MLIKQPIQHVFVQLTALLNELNAEDYTKPGKILFGATIGQHVRHIIELFQCLDEGYNTGVVNYEKRKRDYRIETDKNLAASLLKEILEKIDRPDKPILLEAEDYCQTVTPLVVHSNYYREIVYNLEHTIHHMALIRVGVSDVSTIALPHDFGMAYATIKHRQQCAQ